MTSSPSRMHRLAAALRSPFGSRPRLGIDLGSTAVRVVELRQRGGRPEVVAAAQPIASGFHADGSIEDVHAVAAQIRELCGDRGLRSAAATTAVPAAACVLRHLQVDAGSRRGLERRVAEAIEALDLDGERDWSVDWSPVGPRGSGPRQRILLAAVPTDVVRSYVACLREADLLPAAVDVDVVALDRLAPLLAAGRGGVTAILDVDGERRVLNVLGDGTAAFHAVLPRPAAGVATDTPGEDLVESLHEVLGFFWTGEGEEAVSQFWLAGAGARTAALAERIELRFRADVAVLQPLRLLGEPEPGAADGPEWALATALALRSLERQ